MTHSGTSSTKYVRKLANPICLSAQSETFSAYAKEVQCLVVQREFRQRRETEHAEHEDPDSEGDDDCLGCQLVIICASQHRGGILREMLLASGWSSGLGRAGKCSPLTAHIL